MNETKYDYAKVNTPNRAMFVGKVFESWGDKTKFTKKGTQNWKADDRCNKAEPKKRSISGLNVSYCWNHNV